jgi:hypothetical protein
MLIAMRKAIVSRIGLVFKEPRRESFIIVGKSPTTEPGVDEAALVVLL